MSGWFQRSKAYKISFYNEKKEKVFGNLNNEIDFTKDLIQYEKHFILDGLEYCVGVGGKMYAT